MILLNGHLCRSIADLDQWAEQEMDRIESEAIANVHDIADRHGATTFERKAMLDFQREQIEAFRLEMRAEAQAAWADAVVH